MFIFKPDFYIINTALVALTIYYSVFVKESRMLKILILSTVSYGLSLSRVSFLEVGLNYFIFSLTLILVKQLYADLKQVRFEKGSLTVSYAQVFWILATLILISGLYPTASSWNQGKITGVLGIFSMLVLFLPLTFKEILLSGDEVKQFKGERELYVALYTLFSLALLFAFEKSNFGLNFFGLSIVLLICGLLFFTNKNMLDLGPIKKYVESLTYYPLIKENNESVIKAYRPKGPSLSLTWIKYPNYSYSITVSMLFILLSVVFWGLLV